jgi:hypothetical protein
MGRVILPRPVTPTMISLVADPLPEKHLRAFALELGQASD